MPKRKNQISPAEQRKRFEEEVRKRIEAGELNPTDADAVLDNLVRRQAPPHRLDSHGEDSQEP